MSRGKRKQDHAAKQGAIAFAMAAKNGPMSMCFQNWRVYAQEEKAKRSRKNNSMSHRYAAQFIRGKSSSTMHAYFLEWWKVVKANQSEERIAAAEARAAADAHDVM